MDEHFIQGNSKSPGLVLFEIKLQPFVSLFSDRSTRTFYKVKSSSNSVHHDPVLWRNFEDLLIGRRCFFFINIHITGLWVWLGKYVSS